MILMIDQNGDGKFDPEDEAYDASKPFSIGGPTYQITRVTPDGTQMTLKKAAKASAAKAVPQIPSFKRLLSHSISE